MIRWRSLRFCFLLLVLALPLLANGFISNPESRNISLKGTRNTRDLGGLPVKGGTMKSGQVIRSGALCFASQEDAEKLLGMGVHTIIELRLDSEIVKDGADKSYLTDGIPNRLHWPMGASRGPGLAAYEAYTEENGVLFKKFFTVLANEKSYPVLFHCSAGKDRTGILTALLLDLMGTPRDVIYDDYLHSKRITSALRVEKEWLDAVFERVDAKGGIEPFLDSCGVTADQRQKVRVYLTQR